LEEDMQFCSKCGTLIKLKNPTPQNKFYCDCGQEIKLNSEPVILKEKTIPKKNIEIGDNENRLAVHKHICKKCGYDKAELIYIGAMYGDEGDVIRFRCGKCGYVENIGEKTV
jgi:DNA-directed RNA polymerase subunit M/transcription elongation factor TFIIS